MGSAGSRSGTTWPVAAFPFVILDASERIGDAWRNRWDSLRLFTPARYDGLAWDAVPSRRPQRSPTKNQMADYLEEYAERFGLPVRSRRPGRRAFQAGRAVRGHGGRPAVRGRTRRGGYGQLPGSPVAGGSPGNSDPGVFQLQSKDYRNPSQLRDGGVLIVGAGNSGAEIALEVARGHRTWMSGRSTGHVPFRTDGLPARLFLHRLLFRFVFHRVLTVKTPMGRKVRPKILSQGGPLIRVKPADLAAAGVERVPRLAGVRTGIAVAGGRPRPRCGQRGLVYRV